MYVLTVSEFQAIKDFIYNHKPPTRECFASLKKEFSHVHPHALGSILQICYQRRMMGVHPRAARYANKHFQRFQEAINSGEETGIILRMSNEIDIAPALLGRTLLEKHYENLATTSGTPVSKAAISRQMKDTSLIENRDVAYEVYLSTLFDDQYGPISDIIHHSYGQEYELRLQRLATEKNILFFTEEQLKTKGYDRTPDLKLVLPVAVDGFIVNWIESKALFCDMQTHKSYLKDQYLSYWNRFGPGLVIYWFGYVDEIDQMNEGKLMIRNDFPSNIALMNPQCVKAPSL